MILMIEKIIQRNVDPYQQRIKELGAENGRLWNTPNHRSRAASGSAPFGTARLWSKAISLTGSIPNGFSAASDRSTADDRFGISGAKGLRPRSSFNQIPGWPFHCLVSNR